jgi:primosomal protein N' (replication factor Y)
MNEEAGATGQQRVVRVLPDVPAIDKEFDYLVPAGVAVEVGDVVRIELHGRRVGAWVLEVDVEPAPGVALRPLAKVSGRGPGPELLDLAGWAARRWAGRRASFLRTAAPPGVVRSVVVRPSGVASDVGASVPTGALARALAQQQAVLRLGPGADRYEVVRAAARAQAGQTLVLCPSVAEARRLGARLRRDGIATAIVASDGPGAAAAGEWAHAAGGAQVVVGARAGAWAPAPALARVVVLDEHDEGFQQEQTPTWHARDVAVERARRLGAPCLLVSPCPSLEALAWGELVPEDRGRERAAWPRVEVIDQRQLDPALGPLFSPRLVELVRGDARVACVLNRTGRARLLACGACRTLARCTTCDAAVSLAPRQDGAPDDAPEAFSCERCGSARPAVCTACGAHRFKNLRLGVGRAREELAVLAGTEVAEITAATAADDPGWRDARVLIGTEAVLHRLDAVDVVAFLDLDQELLSLRYRAAEQALALVARAGRLVQRAAVRRGDGRGLVLVQTRTPDHPALDAAVHADPDRLVRSELPMRRALGLPPTTALAVIGGPAAAEFVAAIPAAADVAVQGPRDDRWRVVAPNHDRLAAVLAEVPRPAGRVRVEVDPLRI